MLIHIIGAICSFLSFVVFLPQAIKTWEIRNDKERLSGLSLGTQVLLLCNATGWGVYAVLTHAWWSGAPGLFNAPLAIFVMYLMLRKQPANSA